MCDMLSRSDIVSVTYRCPCNLAGSGPEQCLMTSEKLGIDPESETFGPKNSATYYVSIPHTGQMSLISGKNMLPQVLNNNHTKKEVKCDRHILYTLQVPAYRLLGLEPFLRRHLFPTA